MPKFYFDHHDGAGIEIDVEGVDLPGIDDARRLALEPLGQTILDGARGCLTGRIAIEVRDQAGAILRASAAMILENSGQIFTGRALRLTGEVNRRDWLPLLPRSQYFPPKERV
jgi:hypothetical protein